MKLEMVPIQGKEKSIFSNFDLEQVNPYNAPPQGFYQSLGNGWYTHTAGDLYYYGSTANGTNQY